MINFKVGDRIKCINNKSVRKFLTINKIYIVASIVSFNSLFITANDLGFRDWFNTFRFIKIDCLKYKIRKLKRLINK